MCYPGFVMTPNVFMLYYLNLSIGNLTKAYSDLYNVGYCYPEFMRSGDSMLLPSCVPSESALYNGHCGLPYHNENGRAVEYYFPGADDDSELSGDNIPRDGKAQMMLQKMLLPQAARYECDDGYVLQGTVNGSWGFCREDGGMEVPDCERSEQASTMTFKLHAGGNVKTSSKKKMVREGIVMVKKDALDYSGKWVLALKDGSNNFAAGAICRTLGFKHGQHIEANKKMMRGLASALNDGGEVNYHVQKHNLDHRDSPKSISKDKENNNNIYKAGVDVNGKTSDDIKMDGGIYFESEDRIGYTNFTCLHDETLPTR